MKKNILLSINSFNRFVGPRGSFREWWDHIETMVIHPYRDMLDVAIYDDGSTDEGMIDFLCSLKSDGRIDWLTLGPERNHLLPLIRTSRGNLGYAYSTYGWPEHEFILHFDTDIWFVKPEEDKGFDWLNTCMDRLRGSPGTFATSLWGCLWSNGPDYSDDRWPSWFHLSWSDPLWVESDFFTSRMFLARTGELEKASKDALTEIGQPGKTRNKRRSLIGKIDSYERLANKNIVHAHRRNVAILRGDYSGVITRHLDRLTDLKWAKLRLGIRQDANIKRSKS
jgi:hypothetical protein